MAEGRSSEETLLSYIARFATHDALPTAANPNSLHPFSSLASSSSVSSSQLLKSLHNLADASLVLSNSLSEYSSNPPNADSKLVSKLHECSAFINGLHVSEQNTRQRISALTNRALTRLDYGEPIPLDREQLIPWCISRIAGWGTQAGMETFTEEKKEEDKTVVVLGGKVLVIDVELGVRNSFLKVLSLKTSHALPSGASSNAHAERSDSLDESLSRSWNAYLEEVQRYDVESTLKAGRLSQEIQNRLAYLMKLDNLMVREGDKGIRWFNDVGHMSAVVEKIVKSESDAVLSSLPHSNPVPLDIFLNRAHSISLPYLTGPSMSFLVHLSPVAYYSLLTAAMREKSSAPLHWPFDISPSVIRTLLGRYDDRPSGATTATLELTSDMVSVSASAKTSLSDLSSGLVLAPSELLSQLEDSAAFGPHFHLPGTTILSSLDHNLPEQIVAGDELQDQWVLDFTDGGTRKGIVMTHSRMKEIQNIVRKPSSSTNHDFLHLPYPGNWIGLLLYPNEPPSERYVAIYKSPSDAHPSLRLRLTVPNEAGFYLGKVPVRSLKDVLAVLEVVRNQCWLIEALKSCDWVPESQETNIDDGSAAVTEADLDAILHGTYESRQIPVNVFIPYHSLSSLSGIDGAFAHQQQSDSNLPGLLVMTLQSRDVTGAGSHTGSSQLSITVAHDKSRPKGCRVEVGGTLPYTTQQVGELEEFARRGAIFGVAGKVWKWTST